MNLAWLASNHTLLNAQCVLRELVKQCGEKTLLTNCMLPKQPVILMVVRNGLDVANTCFGKSVAPRRWDI